MSQTLFSLYFHNQQTNLHKLSCAKNPQIMAIHTYIECTKAITNNQDIRLSVTVKVLLAIITNLRPQSWSKGKTLYRVYTRELDRELCTGLSSLYSKTSWSMLLLLAYPKQPCVCLKINMYFTYGMMSSFQNLLHLSMGHVTCNHHSDHVI